MLYSVFRGVSSFGWSLLSWCWNGINLAVHTFISLQSSAWNVVSGDIYGALVLSTTRSLSEQSRPFIKMTNGILNAKGTFVQQVFGRKKKKKRWELHKLNFRVKFMFGTAYFIWGKLSTKRLILGTLLIDSPPSFASDDCW